MPHSQRTRTLWKKRESIGVSIKHEASPILIPGDRQMARIYGYSMGFAFNPSLSTQGHDSRALLALQTRDTDWEQDVFTFFDENVVTGTPVANATIFEVITWYQRLFEQGTEGASVVGGMINHPWATCDVVVPALWAYWFGNASVTGNFVYWAVIEYEMVRASIAEITAFNLAWGRGGGRPLT